VLRETDLDVASLAAAAGCRLTVASQRGAHVRALLTEALFHADHHVRSYRRSAGWVCNQLSRSSCTSACA